jgi:hypothetical protein
MANSYSTNPIVLTAGVASFKAASASVLGTLNTLIIQKIYWENPGISQTLSIGDPISGTVLQLLKSDTTGEDVNVDYVPPRLWSDFSVDVWPGGTVQIFLR